jgi:glycosyltransferase involved in cell wall biosynthesis
MHIDTQPNAKVLLTTPDYPPKLGGLSTFTLNIEKVLDHLSIAYDRLVWGHVGELKKMRDDSYSYEWAIHIHFMAGHFLPFRIKNHLNFIHGSEILFTSPNPFKHLVKKLLRKKMLDYFSCSNMNVFVSEVTRSHLVKQGHQLGYGRDLVLPNCIDLNVDGPLDYQSDYNSEIIYMVCVARNVEHKNIKGAFDLCKSAAKILTKKIVLYVTAPLESFAGVEIIDISGIDYESLQKIYQKSHFNILLSLDHHKQGFFEGFGLTVLEAGQYGTPSIVSCHGGLVEAVHHRRSGWVLDKLTRDGYDHFWSSLSEEQYLQVSVYVGRHTNECHGLNHYVNFLGKLLS